MYSTNKVFEDLINDGSFSSMSTQQIESLCKENSAQTFNELDALKIPGVPDSAYQAFVQFALDQGYDEDEFINLIEVKIARHFFDK